MNLLEAPGTYRLPDASPVRQLNAHETDHLYREIFERKAYLRHGVRLGPGAVVFDVGAHIGLFTLYVKRLRPDARIHAFEPGPAAYKCLAANAAPYRDKVRTYNVGLSDHDGYAPFTYYPGQSSISGFRPDRRTGSAVIKTGMKHRLKHFSPEQIDALVADRMREKAVFSCRTVTLSRAIRESDVTEIDLLKIDAEGSELAILQGIEDEDWPKIRQIAVEVHDEPETKIALSMITDRGFAVMIDEEPWLAASGIRSLYAIRR